MQHLHYSWIIFLQAVFHFIVIAIDIAIVNFDGDSFMFLSSIHCCVLPMKSMSLSECLHLLGSSTDCCYCSGPVSVSNVITFICVVFSFGPTCLWDFSSSIIVIFSSLQFTSIAYDPQSQPSTRCHTDQQAQAYTYQNRTKWRHWQLQPRTKPTQWQYVQFTQLETMAQIIKIL